MEIGGAEASSSSSPIKPIFNPNGFHPTIHPSTIPPQSVDGIFSAESDLLPQITNSNLEQVNGVGMVEKRSGVKMRKKRKVLANGVCAPASSSVVGRGISVRRSPRAGLVGNSRRKSEVEAIALPLGMSIAAVFAQVLDTKKAVDETAYIDYLSEFDDHPAGNFFSVAAIQMFYTLNWRVLQNKKREPAVMCSLAVKEALLNVFGDKFDCFVGNFEKSFRSTLRTVRLVNESSLKNGKRYRTRKPRIGTYSTVETGSTSDHNIAGQSTHCTEDCLSIIAPSSDENENIRNLPQSFRNLELDLHSKICQDLVSASPVRTSSAFDSSVVGTFQKSVVEQTRANDLKAYEITLLMEKLKLKETKLALDSESNYLDRFKLSTGLSKASFKAEKFKTQLEDTRHGELLRSCIDCLVGSLLITSASLMYGTYVHSYKRITKATASCTPSKTSKSWWVPKTFDDFSSGFQMISCHVQVLSRMLFGVLMILAITYLLLQRSAAPRQSMPITFILLILGAACGFAGKLCVDTLGGDGLIWLWLWETMCFTHFLANTFTSALFPLLYGPISFNLHHKNRSIRLYWFRRVIFYAILLIILPLTCGFIPFASLIEWKNHFGDMVKNAFIS